MDKLIPSKESLMVEFKSNKKKLSDDIIIDSVVAFANTEGGDLYLGVEDNGHVSGRHESHKDFTQLSAFIANRTIPPVSVRVEQIEAELPVIKISVPKSRSIVASSSGKIQRRQIKMDGTPENIPMYPYEINTRLTDLSLLDYSAQPVPNAQYSDLDSVEREHLRNILRNYNGEKLLLDLDDEALDKALQLVTQVGDNLVPTFTGMLLIGKKEKLRQYIPTSEASFQAFKGTEVSVNESFYLPILSAIEKIFAFIEARNVEQEMEIGLFRISIPAFDKRAVREAIVNAFVHRDYTRLGRVRVQLDSDGMTVSNPGGFIEGVTVKNILTAEPHGRNPVLADALKRIGLAERSGRGVDRIFEGSLQYGRPLPDYSESTSTNVKLYIPTSLPDENFVRMISEYQKDSGAILPLNSLLILNVLRQGRRMSIHEIAEETNISEMKVRSVVEKLAEAGLLETLGNTRGRVYILSAKVYHDKAGYVRQTGIEKIRYTELIMRLVEQQKIITRKDVINLLHVTPSQAYRVLKKLVENGELEISGSTRNAQYTKNKV